MKGEDVGGGGDVGFRLYGLGFKLNGACIDLRKKLHISFARKAFISIAINGKTFNRLPVGHLYQ